jgi:hypothetical protein
MGSFNNTPDNLAGDLYVIRGLQDPSSVATQGAKGTVFIRVGTLGGSIYQKQDDGETTNWSLVAGGGGTDINVKVSGPDTVTGFLSDKLVAGTGIAALTILNPGADEDLEIALDTAFTDGRYFQQSAFINISAGAGDAGKPVVLDAAGQFDSSMIPAGAGDEFVKVSAADTTAGRLDTKTTAGNGITLTILSPGANESLEIAVDEASVDHNSLNNLAVGDPHTQYVLGTVLASVANAEGASLIGIEDAGGYFTGADVEAALQELGAGTAGGVPTKERLTLIAGDITNQFIDLANEAIVDSVLLSISGIVQEEAAGIDYSTSVVGGVTRVTFETNLATSGASELIAGDILSFQYLRV